MSESKLNIIIDSRTAEQKARDLTRVLEALEQAGIRVSRTLSGQITGNNANAAAAGRNSSSVRTLTNTTTAYSTVAQRAEMGNHALWSSLTGVVAGALSATTAYAGFKAVLAVTDEYKVMEGQIRLVTDSQQQLMSIMQQLTAMSQAAGGELTASVELYAKFANASRDLSGATDEVLVRITDIVNKFVAIGGSSGASAAAGIFQFSQAMASGVLRGQEYNSILEQTPGLAKALADGLGVSMGVMRNMANEGQLTSDLVMNALLKMGGTADKQFGSMSRTSKQAFTIIKREISEATNEIDRNLGSSAAFVKTVEGLSKTIKEISFKTQTGEINMLTGAIGVLTAVALKALLSATASVVTGIGAKIVAMRAATIAAQQQAAADLASSRSAVLKAQNEQALAVIAANKARATLTAAEAQVASDRAVMASEIQRMNSTRAQIQVEKALEVQRLSAQITEQGRQATIARMAQLRQVETVVTRELQAAEAQLTATTLAGSQAVTAARTAQTAAIGRQATATEALNVANGRAAASQVALTAATNTGANAARGLLGVFGGPVGLVVTLAAVAGGIWMATSASDSMKLSIDKLGSSVKEATEKFKGLGFAQRDFMIFDDSKKLNDLTDKVVDARRRFVEAAMFAEVPPANQQKLDAVLDGIDAKTISVSNAFKMLQGLGIEDFRMREMRSAASEHEQFTLEMQSKSSMLKALAVAHKEAEVEARKRAAAEAAAKAATGGIGLKNPNEKGDAEAAKMLVDMQERYASTKNPSAYAATQRELEALAKAGKPVSAEVQAQLLAVAKAQDELTAANARGKLETRQNIKDQKELARELERRRDAYADLVTESSTPVQKINAEYEERKALIDEFADRSNGKYTEMTNWAISERDRERAATEVARAKTIADYLNWNQTEIQSIKSRYESERKEILLLKGFTLDERQQMIDALKAAEQKALDDTTSALRSSYDQRFRIGEEFRLRQLQIEQSNLPDDQKDIAMDVARNVNNDAIAAQQKPYTDMMSELNGESPELTRLKADNEARMLIIRDALTLEQITKEEADAADLAREKAHRIALRDLAVNSAMDIAGSLSSIMKSTAGEQSKAYKVMFAIEKGFAIAKSVMAIQTAMASASMSLPFPGNLGAMAIVAAQTASIVSNIMSVKMAGQAHAGIDYVPKEGTWLLDKGERVLSPKQNSDLTNYMQRDAKAVKSDAVVAGGGINITIENHTSAKFEVQQLSESEVRIIARDEVAKGAAKASAAEFSNPNSSMSKGLKQNYQVEPRR